MKKKETQKTRNFARQSLSRLIEGLARSGLKPLSRILIQAILIRRGDRPVRPNAMPVAHPEAPTGPFVTRHKNAMGDLLLFVPRSIESHLIDHTTGGYGYSHVAIDCGEVELTTNQQVMVESTVNNPVWRSRQDRYGARPFVRIPLADVGVPVQDFCKCVQSHLGEPYDNLEALTWREVDDPAKQICSDLAADCLPADLIMRMVDAYRSGKMRKNSLSIHRDRSGQVRAFFSPNGFGEFFGAPVGSKVHQPDQRSLPRPLRGKHVNVGLPRRSERPFVWTVLAGVVGAGLIGWAFGQLLRKAAPKPTLSVSPPGLGEQSTQRRGILIMGD